MRLVSTLLGSQDQTVFVQGHIAPDCPFLDSCGFVTPAGLMEMAAQSCACLQGLRAAGTPPREAFLVGMKNFTHTAPAHRDDPLIITVTPAAELDGFFMADARINRDTPEGQLVASVRIKAYCPQDSGDNTHAPV